jgi:hypothetical protein
MGSIVSSSCEPSIFMPNYFHYRHIAYKFMNELKNNLKTNKIDIYVEDILQSGDVIYNFKDILPYIDTKSLGYKIINYNDKYVTLIKIT